VRQREEYAFKKDNGDTIWKRDKTALEYLAALNANWRETRRPRAERGRRVERRNIWEWHLSEGIFFFFTGTRFVACRPHALCPAGSSAAHHSTLHRRTTRKVQCSVQRARCLVAWSLGHWRTKKTVECVCNSSNFFGFRWSGLVETLGPPPHNRH
jgi:hypothetical protein